MRLVVDHLVVGAATLEQGVAWCEATLGVTPAPGGAHPLMSTHNRLLRIDGPGFARAYLEIIAIDPAAPPPGRTRWYDLDDPALQARLVRGPALIHWVAGVADLDAAGAAWRAAGIERGEALQASRGALRWRIAVRRDGARLAQGQWPTLIEWGAAHPNDSLPASPVALRALTLRGLPDWLRAPLAEGIGVADDAGAPLEAVLATPLGERRLAVDAG